MKRRIVLTVAAFALFFWSFIGVVQATDLKTVALQVNKTHLKDESPEAGFFYTQFENPAVSDATGERVTFFANTKQDPGVGMDRMNCIWKVDATGTGSAVACKGDASPDGRKFLSFTNPSINDDGDVAWSSIVSGLRSGVYKGDPTIVSLFDDSAEGGFLREFSKAIITDDGDVIYRARIFGVPSAEDTAIFRCTGGDGDCSSGTGTLETLVQKGDSVPDRAGREFCSIGDFAASTWGIVFRGSTKLDCANAIESSKEGIFRKKFGEDIVTLALKDEDSEPNPGGTKYGGFGGTPAIEDSGIVAFRAETKGLLVEEHLYICDPAACPANRAEIAVKKFALDDDGNKFLSFSSPALSNAGDMGFVGQVEKPDKKKVPCLYIRRFADGDIETVRCKGQNVPDVPGTVFQFFGQPSMSPSGKVAFKGKIKETDFPKKEFEGIFLLE